MTTGPKEIFLRVRILSPKSYRAVSDNSKCMVVGSKAMIWSVSITMHLLYQLVTLACLPPSHWAPSPGCGEHTGLALSVT